MKRIILSVITFILSFIVVHSQDIQNNSVEIKNYRRCATTEYMKKQKAINSSLEKQIQQIEEFTQQWIKNNPTESKDKTIITIPVVVHVVYYNSAQNIPDGRINEQITILNNDYGKLNTHSMGVFDPNLKVDTELRFCLAKRTPTGVYTTGIVRKQTTVNGFTDNDKVKHTSQGGSDQWNPNKYMNIWVCNFSEDGLCGYAQFPSSPLDNNYGVVINYKYFGLSGYQNAPYNLGGTTSHEIGHCFNLYHIWGDDYGSCTGSDMCNDTPNQAEATYGNNSGLLTDACSGAPKGIMYMNFMDYSNDITYSNFTPNQKSRIQALFTTGGPLVSLKSSNGCTPGIGAGIDETKDIGDFNIYPNPTTGSINVSLALVNTGDVTITVSNLLGEIISKVEKQKISSINIPIDISTQSSGIYYVKIQTASETLTKKISLVK
ncbi:MAG: T9SS type A sorting domain-containing protein [Bacteroidetes bacterium]|nr:T9SS type A sorting domain-containing protein [Bacteroidota bacterium]